MSIPEEGIVSYYLKQGDSIIYELKYDEIWLKVDLDFICTDENFTHKLKIKIELDWNMDKLIEKIISASIQIFNHNIEEKVIQNRLNYNENKIFYLFQKIEVDNRQLKEMNELEDLGTLRSKFNFESKIYCKCYFVNLNNIIYQKVIYELKQTKGKQIKSKNIYSTFINSRRKFNEVNPNYVEQYIQDLIKKHCHLNNSFGVILWKNKSLSREEQISGKFFDQQYSLNNSRSNSYDENHHDSNNLYTHNLSLTSRKVSSNSSRGNALEFNSLSFMNSRTKDFYKNNDSQLQKEVQEFFKNLNLNLNQIINENTQQHLKYHRDLNIEENNSDFENEFEKSKTKPQIDIPINHQISSSLQRKSIYAISISIITIFSLFILLSQII